MLIVPFILLCIMVLLEVGMIVLNIYFLIEDGFEWFAISVIIGYIPVLILTSLCVILMISNNLI